MVHNGSQPIEWKLPGFKYRTIFTPEIIASTRATGLIMCNKGQLRHSYLSKNSSSISKLNSTSYTYLGHADTVNHTNGSTNTSVVSSSVPPTHRISRPITGEVPQGGRQISNIIGKPHPNANTTNHIALSFTLEDLLPPAQQAPKNSSGEFINQMSNAKFKYNDLH
jgi:hypothetical protein